MYHHMTTVNTACAPAVRHRLILIDWVQRGEDMLWTQELPLAIDDCGRQRIGFLLLNRLEAVAGAALDSLLQKKLSAVNPIAALNMELVPQADREEASGNLLNELRENDYALLRVSMPLLLPLLDRCVRQFADMMQEMFVRISENRREISETFFGGVDMGALTDFSCDGADLHFDGKCTVIVGCEQGKFLYKPRDCGTDAFYQELVERWFSDITAAPRCIAGNGFGFCEFIQPESACEKDTVERYFRNFGGLAALFQALGSSDLHIENFLMRGDKPVLIDLETLFTPVPKVFGEKELPQKGAGFIDALNHSLFASSLLPKDANGKNFSPLMNRSDVWRGLPVLNGQVQTVQEHMDAFFRGFEAVYRRCMSIRDELTAALGKAATLHVRRLIRNTNYYATLQKQLYSFAALGSADKQEKILSKLCSYFEKMDAAFMFPLTDAEARALRRGDIPYFYAEADSCDLLADNSVALPGYFKQSAVDHAQQRISRMSEAELRFEMQLLREAFQNAVVPLVEGKRLPLWNPKAVPMLTDSDLKTEAEHILDRICSSAICAPDGSVHWLENHESHLAPMKVDLMLGIAGLGAYFAAHHAVMQDNRSARYAEICLENIAVYIQNLEEANPAHLKLIPPGLSGAAGVMRALRIMEVCMGGCGDLMTRMLSLLWQFDFETARADVFAGISGLIIELCSDGKCKDLQLLRRCADCLLAKRTLQTKDGSLLWDCLENGRAISGLGHGMAGIGLALLKAYRFLDDTRLLDAAKDAFAWEHDIYSDRLTNWPDLRKPGTPGTMHGCCSGAPGIGLALLACMDYRDVLPHWQEDLNRALDACLTTPLMFRDHLCCGNSSAVDFLLEAGAALKRKDLTQSARMLLSRMAKRRDGDYAYLPPAYKPAFTPTLFYGAAGVGYVLLRTIRQELPSILI